MATANTDLGNVYDLALSYPSADLVLVLTGIAASDDVHSMPILSPLPCWAVSA